MIKPAPCYIVNNLANHSGRMYGGVFGEVHLPHVTIPPLGVVKGCEVPAIRETTET